MTQTPDSSDNTLWYNIWLQYNSLRTKYKPQVIRTYDDSNKLIIELSSEEFRHLLYEAQKKRLYKKARGFIIGITRKYHYNIQHDQPLILSTRQLNFLQSLSSR